MNRNKIDTLQKIWADIPASDSRQVELPREDIIKKFLDLFQPGHFFYNIFNTQSSVIEYISPETKLVLGYAPEEMNLALFLKIMHPDDIPYYIHHEKCATEFFKQLPVEKRNRYKYSHDIRFLHASGGYRRILIQVIPVYFFTEGGARTLCVFTDITHLKSYGKPRISFIGMEGEPSYFNMELDDKLQELPRSFTKREQEILELTVQGKTGNEIAAILNISRYTVDTHRKHILAKSGCATVNELIVKAVTEGYV